MPLIAHQLLYNLLEKRALYERSHSAAHSGAGNSIAMVSSLVGCGKLRLAACKPIALFFITMHHPIFGARLFGTIGMRVAEAIAVVAPVV